MVFNFGSLSQQESTQVHIFQSWLGKFFQQLHPCHVTFLPKIFFNKKNSERKGRCAHVHRILGILLLCSDLELNLFFVDAYIVGVQAHITIRLENILGFV